MPIYLFSHGPHVFRQYLHRIEDMIEIKTGFVCEKGRLDLVCNRAYSFLSLWIEESLGSRFYPVEKSSHISPIGECHLIRRHKVSNRRFWLTWCPISGTLENGEASDLSRGGKGSDSRFSERGSAFV